jgi:hypothetical protein
MEGRKEGIEGIRKNGRQEWKEGMEGRTLKRKREK